ncbi:MAG TPA: hypothetical protein VMF61_05720 [Candidatus Acidoferrales bacterium]|nr:hypothetical protein [Candidatus Acidoferrales bacterium]
MRALTAACIAAFLCFASFLLRANAATVDATPVFGAAGSLAVDALVDDFYAHGAWRACDDAGCSPLAGDWGADSATDDLYLRWRSTRSARIAGMMQALAAAAPAYAQPCDGSRRCNAWSDTAAWDAVAAMREFEVTGDPQAETKAEAALRFIDTSRAFDGGACPELPYQQPAPTASHVKTLETTANQIKALLLLYRATRDGDDLQRAQSAYDAVRHYFFDPGSGLYTVHVVDDGTACVRRPNGYFASVNGLMIWNGLELSRALDDPEYRRQALATAHAVDTELSDDRGIFADVGGENDVVEPLVEAMERLAARDDGDFARAWIVRNARAALQSRDADGSFGRFFDGPPQGHASLWQSNGAVALEIAAAALTPGIPVAAEDAWSASGVTRFDVTSIPATLTVDGAAFALIGTIGPGYEGDHIHVTIDGRPLTDRTGLWQNPSMPSERAVLFAWAWKRSGRHVITLSTDRDAPPGASLALQGEVVTAPTPH